MGPVVSDRVRDPACTLLVEMMDGSSDPTLTATIMEHVHEGQCGLCSHFGETHLATEKIVQIRVTKEAPPTLTDECGHPRHASLHLVVTPISGCTGFEAAQAM